MFDGYRKNDNVRSVKGEDPSAFEKAWDRVYITTLFSFEWERTARSIDYTLGLVGGKAHRVLVGGIAASLMHEKSVDEPRWRGVRLIKGLLGEAPATHSTKAKGDFFESPPARKRATYKEVFDLFYDCSVNQVAAKSLNDRMIDCLS